MIDNQIQNLADTEAAKSSMTIASSGQRFGNYILDLFFLYAFGFVFGLALYIIGLGDFIDQMNETLFGLIIFLLYYVPQEAFLSWTLGKLITGTKVVDNLGLPISFGQAVGRGLCRFIPFEAFSFLGGRGSPVGWHDRIPKTLVISIRNQSSESALVLSKFPQNLTSGFSGGPRKVDVFTRPCVKVIEKLR